VIDIMIPYWGRADRLLAAVASVRAQTSPDWRLTVIDDCYPDPAGGEAVQALGDPRIRYLRNATNRGITENFRRCLAEAQADHVVVMGCDDLALPGFVEAIGEALARHPEADIVQVGVETIDANGRVVLRLADRVKRWLTGRPPRHPVVFAGESAAASLLRGNWLYWPSLALKRSTLERHDFRDGFPVIQDLALVIDLLLDGATLVYYPRTAFQYRRHEASASGGAAIAGDRFEIEARYFRLAARLMEGAGWRRAARAARWHVTSRLHALSLVPHALMARDARAVRLLMRHVVGGGRERGPERPDQGRDWERGQER
jgi:glycosyltransferase involved in cell wall biosynthesis